MNIEVLVATMQQSGFSLVEEMNICQNAVIANQCGKWDYAEQKADYGVVRMLSSDTRGVGINRNLTLQLAEADILLFADDDITYYDGAFQGVMDAFAQLPDADVIFFGIDMTRNGKVFDKRRNKMKRIHLWNSLKYGAARMAIRREAVVKSSLAFSALFGGGCKYGSGEDSLFICDCFRKGLHLYSHPHVLGKCAKDSSSWFSGFNEKFLFDKGAWIACAFPKSKHIMKWYFLWRYSKKIELSLSAAMRYMNCGIRAYRNLESFEDVFTTKKY